MYYIVYWCDIYVIFSLSLTMAELIGGVVGTELVKQLFAVSRKAFRCRGVAQNLATMIEGVQPAIKEIFYSGVEVSPHLQVQLRMYSETLDRCRKLTDKVLKCQRWNMVRQLYHAKKMEVLEKKIFIFIQELNENLRSMKIGGLSSTMMHNPGTFV